MGKGKESFPGILDQCGFLDVLARVWALGKVRADGNAQTGDNFIHSLRDVVIKLELTTHCLGALSIQTWVETKEVTFRSRRPDTFLLNRRDCYRGNTGIASNFVLKAFLLLWDLSSNCFSIT